MEVMRWSTRHTPYTAHAHVEGTIVTALFLGNHTRLLVEVGAARPLIVDTARRDAWQPGERVGLRIDTDNLITLVEAA